ncbi:MAG: hypothetical protein WA814_09665 [Candidatus Baltobacteraceae bacterium]
MEKRPDPIRFLAAWTALPLLAACAGPGTASLPSAGVTRSVAAGKEPGKGVIYQGCPVFGHGGAYNGVVTKAAIDPNSAQYISSVIQAGDTMGFYASTGVEQVNLANDQTPLLTVQPKVKYHQFPVAYPWQSYFYIEPLGDAHAIVVQTQKCHLFEAYGTSYAYPTLSAYCGANWSLRDHFVPLPPGTPSGMASGLPLMAGMVRWEDYQAGSIDHALNWDGIANTVSQYSFVRPASDTDWLPFGGSSSYQIPYGAHLRLKASFSTSGWGPQATMVANAMKTYGVYLADTGSGGNAIYFANASDGTNPWSSSDLSALSQITMSDFDVLKLKNVEQVPGH